MILLDTHIWVWWVHGDSRLSPDQQRVLQEHEESGLGVSTISCWEVAKLVEYKRLELPCPVLEWLDQADQILVATARVFGVPLVTADEKILAYPHVQLLPSRA
jgi:PIN domain nuclease of toxin-antitoxin system